jgi:hypothetical protein
MKKKIILVLTFVIAILIIAVIVYKWHTFKLFDVEITSLAKIPFDNKGCVIDISLVETGATTEDVIQIRKVSDNGEVQPIKSFERYNHLIDCKKINDTTILLILKDTSYYANQADTFKINIP